MIRYLLTLFIAVSVLVAPIAHAAGIDCKAVGIAKMEVTKKVSDDEKSQDTDQAGKLAHHCCTYFAVKLDVALTAQQWVSSKVGFPLDNDSIGSIVLGPPLKPPSHA